MPCSSMTRSVAVWFALCAAAACASSGANRGSSQFLDTAVASPTRRSANLITEEELAKTASRDAHHAVQLLRPDWLRPRGAASFNGAPADVMVYVNGQRFGTSESLSQLQASSIRVMSWISPSEATNRYGTGHNSGAIIVLTK